MSSAQEPPEAEKAPSAGELIDRFLDSIDPALRSADPTFVANEAEARNAGVVHVCFRHVAQGDFDALAEAFHDEVEFTIEGPPTVPFLGRWSGRAEVAEVVRRNFAMLEAQEPAIESFVAQGRHVVVVLRERGRYITTGLPYSVRCAQVFTIEDGKVRRIREIIADEPG